MNRVEIERRTRIGVQKALDESVVALSAEIRRTLSQRGGGIVYRIGKGNASGRNLRERGFHQASAPGQPPAVNTGTLRRSWQIGASRLNRVDRTKVTDAIKPSIRLGTVLRYARYLEYGTRKMFKRPYAFRSRDALLDSGSLNRIFSSQIARELRR